MFLCLRVCACKTTKSPDQNAPNKPKISESFHSLSIFNLSAFKSLGIPFLYKIGQKIEKKRMKQEQKENSPRISEYF